MARASFALLLALAVAAPAQALLAPSKRSHGLSARSSVRLDFGKMFYMGHEYAPPNGPEGPLAPGVVEVALQRPLGINFQEISKTVVPAGVSVVGLVDEGNAAKSGAVAVGDVLVGITAVRFVGAKFERAMWDCTAWDFDRVVEAIGSNEPKWRCTDVILQFTRPEAAV
ncbi:hypothetical protein M885DRAFT_508623 [Pelagophyceae sp. CCMP2097]|nr:hypothetical protein M885DRAFT_508623 [Pelagophyceae sp. CCMP2097]